MHILRTFFRKLYERSGYCAFLCSMAIALYVTMAIFNSWNTERTVLDLLNERSPAWPIWVALFSIMLMVFLGGRMTSFVNKRRNR